MILGRQKLWIHIIGLRCITAQRLLSKLNIRQQTGTLSLVVRSM